jgi:hypothetical protein
MASLDSLSECERRTPLALFLFLTETADIRPYDPELINYL